MFKVGDIVRLVYGHKPLQILEISDRGMITAKYCHRHTVYLHNFENPINALGTQKRHIDGFKFYGGQRPYYAYDFKNKHPQKPEVKETMQQQYMRTRVVGAVNSEAIIGTHIATLKNGELVLEMNDGSAFVGSIHELQEYYAPTFSAKALNRKYSCHYYVPPNTTINVDDILVSDSGNLYVVTAVSELCNHYAVKGTFSGKRLVSQEL